MSVNLTNKTFNAPLSEMVILFLFLRIETTVLCWLQKEKTMQQKVALALGSGGARGLAHIGVIEELENQGFKIASASGSSMGAVIGGFYAMGKLQDYADWMCTLKKRDVYSLMDVAISQSGLLRGERVFSKMKELIPDMLIEEMNIPFSAIATEIISRKEMVFTSGSFYKAARASVAIPAIITPFSAGNKIFVDGGLLNPVPVNHVKRTPGDILVAVNLYDHSHHPPLAEKENKKIHESHKKSDLHKSMHVSSSIEFFQQKIRTLIPKSDKQNQGYLTLMQLTSSMMLTRIANLLLELSQPDIIINIPAESAKTFEFHKAAKLIDFGRKAAREAISGYQKNQ